MSLEIFKLLRLSNIHYLILTQGQRLRRVQGQAKVRQSQNHRCRRYAHGTRINVVSREERIEDHHDAHEVANVVMRDQIIGHAPDFAQKGSWGIE